MPRWRDHIAHRRPATRPGFLPRLVAGGHEPRRPDPGGRVVARRDGPRPSRRLGPSGRQPGLRPRLQLSRGRAPRLGARVVRNDARGRARQRLNAFVQAPGHTSIGASTAVFATLGILAAYTCGGLRSIVPSIALLAFLGMGGMTSRASRRGACSVSSSGCWRPARCWRPGTSVALPRPYSSLWPV